MQRQYNVATRKEGVYTPSFVMPNRRNTFSLKILRFASSPELQREEIVELALRRPHGVVRAEEDAFRAVAQDNLARLRGL